MHLDLKVITLFSFGSVNMGFVWFTDLLVTV
jgi:hypothetical protein